MGGGRAGRAESLHRDFQKSRHSGKDFVLVLSQVSTKGANACRDAVSAFIFLASNNASVWSVQRRRADARNGRSRVEGDGLKRRSGERYVKQCVDFADILGTHGRLDFNSIARF